MTHKVLCDTNHFYHLFIHLLLPFSSFFLLYMYWPPWCFLSILCPLHCLTLCLEIPTWLLSLLLDLSSDATFSMKLAPFNSWHSLSLILLGTYQLLAHYIPYLFTLYIVYPVFPCSDIGSMRTGSLCVFHWTPNMKSNSWYIKGTQ